MRRRPSRLTLTWLACVLALPSWSHADTVDPTKPAATPGLACDEGSRPETGVQGDIPETDKTSGRIKQGYYCNVRIVARVRPGDGISAWHGNEGGGFRVERYADRAGHVCAYFDSGTLFPNTVHASGSGVWVVDMTNPAKPVTTQTLTSPAMLSPHESLRLNQKRGLLAAAMGSPAANPGFVDIYSVADDCRYPKLQSSSPLGILGHESAFSPDGKTFYSNAVGSMTALDVTDPTSPNLLWMGHDYLAHGASISSDGRTMFVASQKGQGVFDFTGLVILDVSDIQNRKPNPVVREISRLTWPEVSIPQNATPFRSRGHDYLVETDEYGGDGSPVGAARIINIDDLRRPYVVSHLRLAVHNQQNSSKTAHYCTVPSRIDPYIVACGFLFSGMRVFDIRDVARPREVAYANFVSSDPNYGDVFSAPAYDPVHNDVWYTDGNMGFIAVRLTKATGITRFARQYALPGS